MIHHGLASDRLEYTFSNGFGAMVSTVKKLWSVKEIAQMYQNIQIMTNEEGLPELGFQNIEMAERFVHGMSELSMVYNCNAQIFLMQFLADILKKCLEKKWINKGDLYRLSEKEIIEKMEHLPEDNPSKCFAIWKNATQIQESDEKPVGKYSVHIENLKVRYINPLVKIGSQVRRISEISSEAQQDIQKALHSKTKKYAYLDFGEFTFGES